MRKVRVRARARARATGAVGQGWHVGHRLVNLKGVKSVGILSRVVYIR